MSEKKSLTIIIPALEEESNLMSVVIKIIDTCRRNDLDWELILVNDGSRDRTGKIVEELAKTEPRIKVINHQRSRGIGFCFREGVKIAGKDILTWLPADGESELEELLRYCYLLNHLDIVIPFVTNTEVRSLKRRIFSTAYRWIVNLSFNTTFNYTNGNVLYNRKVFNIVKISSNSFFFQTECLIRAVRSGFIFAEVPVRLKKRERGNSKALTFKSFCNVVLDYIRFFINVHILCIIKRVNSIRMK